jgi:hypothetical protein
LKEFIIPSVSTNPTADTNEISRKRRLRNCPVGLVEISGIELRGKERLEALARSDPFSLITMKLDCLDAGKI